MDYDGGITGLSLMLKPHCRANFADRTEDATGKLSFEERDVSFSSVVDVSHCDNDLCNKYLSDLVCPWLSAEGGLKCNIIFSAAFTFARPYSTKT